MEAELVREREVAEGMEGLLNQLGDEHDIWEEHIQGPHCSRRRNAQIHLASNPNPYKVCHYYCFIWFDLTRSLSL